MSVKAFFSSAGIMAATTIGAGIFALPYTVQKAGWGTSFLYWTALVALVIFCHNLYWRVLDQGHGKRFLGLLQQQKSRTVFSLGFIAIIFGLLLTLLAYLVLAGSFFTLFFPGLDRSLGVLCFWLLGSLPLLFGAKRLLNLEFLGTVFIFGIVTFLFGRSIFNGFTPPDIEVFTPDFLLPFGPLLFALAGWTAIEPAHDVENGQGEQGSAFRGLAWGTLFSVLTYAMFILAILISGGEVTSDTISGLAHWPLWQQSLLGGLGILVLITSYVPIAWEIKTAIQEHVALHPLCGLFLALFGPITLFFFGLTSFFLVISLTGGLFSSLQYIFILFLGWRLVPLSSREKMIIWIAGFIFLLAAAYEVLFFLLK